MTYQQMASLYDQFMAHAPYDEWVRFTEKMFANSAGQIQRIADLGCGTGEITLQLASSGYETIGIDNSQEMLTLAEHKASTRNLTVQWLHQDLRELEGLNDLDAAVSYCDVLNYITNPNDLLQSLKNIQTALKPGGLFLFDVHNIDFINENYLNQTFAEVEDEISYIWFCTSGEEPGEMYHDLTFFQLKNGKYERFDEQHHQRTYPIHFYKEILIKSGFENVIVYADFSTEPEKLGENPARIFFSATKGSR